jgi:hypothetical protein
MHNSGNEWRKIIFGSRDPRDDSTATPSGALGDALVYLITAVSIIVFGWIIFGTDLSIFYKVFFVLLEIGLGLRALNTIIRIATGTVGYVRDFVIAWKDAGFHIRHYSAHTIKVALPRKGSAQELQIHFMIDDDDIVLVRGLMDAMEQALLMTTLVEARNMKYVEESSHVSRFVIEQSDYQITESEHLTQPDSTKKTLTDPEIPEQDNADD